MIPPHPETTPRAASESAGTPGSTPAAYYATGTTGWRAWWTLLHPPYTAMHLSFVVTGAALAPRLAWDRLGWTLLAFLLAMGLAAHALDERNGRPLNTRIHDRTLQATATFALMAAAAIGFWGGLHYQLPWGFLFILVGIILVVSYNLELLGGRLHNDLTFALFWGAFPVLVAYYAQTGTLKPAAVAGALYATLASATQRALSTPARDLRRRIRHVTGTMDHQDGTTTAVTKDTLLRHLETALRLLVATSLLVAFVLLVHNPAFIWP